MDSPMQDSPMPFKPHLPRKDGEGELKTTRFMTRYELSRIVGNDEFVRGRSGGEMKRREEREEKEMTR